MNPMKCEFCGSNDFVKVEDFYICQHCSTKYTIEQAKHLVINGPVEIVMGDAEKERLLENANTYLRIGEYNNAIYVFNQIAANYPNDYRGWWGLFTTPIEEYFDTGNFSKSRNRALKNALNLCIDKSIINNYLIKIRERYGSNLRTMKLNTKYIKDYRFQNIDNSDYLPLISIDYFTYWLIYGTKNVINLMPESLKSFIYEMSHLFVSNLRKGIICPTNDLTPPPFYNGPWRDESWKKCESHRLVKYLSIKFPCHITTESTGYTDCCYYIGNGKDKFRIAYILSTNGRWAYCTTFDKFDKNIFWFLMPKEINYSEINDVFKANGLCQHCGGTFKGLIRKYCTNCLKNKDY